MNIESLTILRNKNNLIQGLKLILPKSVLKPLYLINLLMLKLALLTNFT